MNGEKFVSFLGESLRRNQRSDPIIEAHH
jgi:hypothetical protein